MRAGDDSPGGTVLIKFIEELDEPIKLYPQKKIMVKIIVTALLRSMKKTPRFENHFKKLMRWKRNDLIPEYEKALKILKDLGQNEIS